MTFRNLRWLSTLKDSLVELLYPNSCWVCNQLLPDAQARVCPACEHDLTTDPHPTCPRCSSTVGPFVNLDKGCASCRHEGFAFDRTLRLGPYQGALREVILRLKNRRDESLAEVVGAVWAGHMRPRLKEFEPQAVVPVPLHWTRRWWERGFNQSAVLASCLARSLAIECYPFCVRRVRRTPRQTEQATPAERRANVRGAFVARTRHDLVGKTVLVVDDVLTTGATAHEVARALRTLKPARIVVVVLAHGK